MTPPDRADFDPFPWHSMAVWILTQMKRWGYVKGDVNYKQIAEKVFLLSGSGDVIEPDAGIAAIGSGGPYAQAAAQALADHTQLPARQIAEEAMKIAGKMCIYTNDKVTIEEL